MTASDTTLPAPSTRSAASGDQPSWHRWGAIIAVHVACIFLWEAAVRVFSIQPFILPAPSKVLATLGNPSYHWLSTVSYTHLTLPTKA